MDSLLLNERVIKWCFKGITEATLATTSNRQELQKAKSIEDLWGNSVMKTTGSGQWSTKLCENLVEEALVALGRVNVHRAVPKKSTLREKKYSPDLECDNYVYEVKGRSWTTSGTAGEKVLGVPLKYGEVPRLYNKPLQIILVGYQEYEVKKSFAFGNLLDSHDQTQELRDSIAFYKSHNIEYIGFTDILKKLGLRENY